MESHVPMARGQLSCRSLFRPSSPLASEKEAVLLRGTLFCERVDEDLFVDERLGLYEHS